MIICALKPGFWFGLMDPYTREYNEHRSVSPALVASSQKKISAFILKVTGFFVTMAAVGQVV